MSDSQSRHCRNCAAALTNTVLDLGFAPPSNAYIPNDRLNHPEMTFPLRLALCSSCFLLQTEDYNAAEELFDDDYAYFSSTSKSWLDHSRIYTKAVVERFQLTKDSYVVELASNDGYLLQNFLEEGIPCLGIEPTQAAHEAAVAKGIDSRHMFFSEQVAQGMVIAGEQADLIIGNNVYAHVPDINDFTAGISRLLKPQGVVTLEFPHVMELLKFCQFDTVYHEHFSYLSLHVVKQVFAKSGLRVFDVEKLTTHGGSLRVYGCLVGAHHTTGPSVFALLGEEKNQGLLDADTYRGLQSGAEFIKNTFISFLLDQKARGRVVVGYGAAAKGNTLINFAGLKTDLIRFVCDAAPSKQGKYTPGSHIPIVHPSSLRAESPDTVIIFPWNIGHEIVESFGDLIEQGGQFVSFVPSFKQWSSKVD